MDVEDISLRDSDKLDPYLSHNLAVDSDEVYAANSKDVESLGKVKAVMSLNGKAYETELHVYKKLQVSLLSRKIVYCARSIGG